MVDKNISGKKACLHRIRQSCHVAPQQLKCVYTGPLKIIWNFCQCQILRGSSLGFDMSRRGFKCRPHYSEFYSILSRRSHLVLTLCYDKARSRTHVNIWSAFLRWRELNEREGLWSDAEVPLFLLHRWVTLALLCFTELIVAYVCVGRSYQNRGETLLG